MDTAASNNLIILLTAAYLLERRKRRLAYRISGTSTSDESQDEESEASETSGGTVPKDKETNRVDKTVDEVNNNEPVPSGVATRENGSDATMRTINPAAAFTVYPTDLSTPGASPQVVTSETESDQPPGKTTVAGAQASPVLTVLSGPITAAVPIVVPTYSAPPPGEAALGEYADQPPKIDKIEAPRASGSVPTRHTSVVNSAAAIPVSSAPAAAADPPRMMEVKIEPASPPESPSPPPISPTVDVETYDDRGTPSPEEDKPFQPLSQSRDDGVCFYEYDNADRLDVECGNNKATLIVDKLCQGSKGKCIEFMGNLLTPNEFQSVSGRETAKDWKRSIRYRGKSLKTLMARGLIKAHPLLCECHRCKSGLNKRKLGKKSSPESKRQMLDMSIDANYTTQYSSSVQNTPDLKRSRSASPMDIYDAEQKQLFEMANSPEPKNIETFQRSMKSGDSLTPRVGSPEEQGAANDSDPNETAPSTTGHTEVLKTLHYTITKPLGKHRKQTAPKQAVPHIALTAIPSFKTHTVMRPRLHQASKSLTIPPGPSSEGSVMVKRARSLITPTSKSPNHIRMIELTRPAQSSTDRTPTSHTNGDEASYRQSASSTSDTVFLPSEMSNWSVDDVAEFVQSLRGCEEYSQVFREQAIDGEILPVLTEEHLLNNMGLKLGPALKIKIHIAKRLGYHIIDETLQ